jgi:predicted RecA/RadA family phage recombinase
LERIRAGASANETGYVVLCGLHVGKGSRHAVALDAGGTRLHDAELPYEEQRPSRLSTGLPARGPPPAVSRAFADAAGLHALVEVAGADHNDRSLLDDGDALVEAVLELPERQPTGSATGRRPHWTAMTATTATTTPTTGGMNQPASLLHHAATAATT